MAFDWNMTSFLRIGIMLSIMELVLVGTTTMITPGQLYTRRLGDSLTLRCEFRDSSFDQFYNPVIWRKSQQDETSSINIQGTVNAPFSESQRFKVHYSDDNKPVYRFELSIEGLTRADNGNYTCEVRGLESAIIESVTHHVVVQAPVDRVYLTNINNTFGVSTSPSELVYTEGQSGTLRCVSVGGYPIPSVHVIVSGADVGRTMSETLLLNSHGKLGMRALSYTVQRWTHQFIARPEYDNTDVVCTAIVPGLTSQSTAVKMRVQFPPKISCTPVSAYEGERNVSLSCIVSARPRAFSVKWFLNTGSTEFDVMASTAYSSSNRILDDTRTLEVLHISMAGSHRFRTYTLRARNAVGSSHEKTRLIKGAHTESPPAGKHGYFDKNKTAATTGANGSHYIFIISKAAGSTFHLYQIIIVSYLYVYYLLGLCS